MRPHDEKQIQGTFDLKLLQKLMKYTRPYLMLILLSVVLLFASTASDLFRPKIIQTVIDDFLSPTSIGIKASDKGFELQEGTFSFDKKASDNLEGSKLTLGGQTRELSTTEKESLKSYRIQQVTFYGLIMGVLILVTFGSVYLQQVTLNWVGQKVIYHIRSDLFGHLSSLDLRFHERNPVGRLVTRMTNDLNNINELYTSVIVTFLSDFAIIVGSMVMMMVLHFKLALISLSVLPILAIMTVIFRREIRKAYRLVRIKLARINATLNENFMGMKTIQIFNQEAKFIRHFDAINDEYYWASRKELTIYAIFRPLMNFLYLVSSVLAVIFGGFMVMRGEIDVGVVVAFTLYIRQLYRPIMELAEKFNILQAAMTSIERIFLLFEEESGIQNQRALPIDKLKGHVVFDHVSFSYIPGEPVLKDVSFEVLPGQTIAFVGATGSGKSTIINLLTRLYDVDEGRILIDGVDIRNYDKHALRKHISPVLQDVFLFSGDIRGNIRLLNEEIDDASIMKANRYVNADRFIDRFKEGLDHAVTEGGTTLSQGERQLLSFARAIVHDPDILILDEATASIDTETEALIQDAIGRIVRDRTTFVVAHRLSTIRSADQIIVIHKGVICERGRHEELLQQRGIYYDLYQLQYEHDQKS